MNYTLHYVHLPVLANPKQYRTVYAKIPPRPCKSSYRGQKFPFEKTASVHEKRNIKSDMELKACFFLFLHLKQITAQCNYFRLRCSS